MHIHTSRGLVLNQFSVGLAHKPNKELAKCISMGTDKNQALLHSLASEIPTLLFGLLSLEDFAEI